MLFGDASYRTPHRAFVEILRVGEAIADEDVSVEEADLVAWDGGGELGFEEVDARDEPAELAALEHVPYDDWQPVPQYALVLPLQIISQRDNTRGPGE
jgi:hypothetical protein